MDFVYVLLTALLIAAAAAMILKKKIGRASCRERV